MKATPTKNDLQLRRADFSSLADALDYAAQGKTGFMQIYGGNTLKGNGYIDTDMTIDPYASFGGRKSNSNIDASQY